MILDYYTSILLKVTHIYIYLIIEDKKLPDLNRRIQIKKLSVYIKN